MDARENRDDRQRSSRTRQKVPQNWTCLNCNAWIKISSKFMFVVDLNRRLHFHSAPHHWQLVGRDLNCHSVVDDHSKVAESGHFVGSVEMRPLASFVGVCNVATVEWPDHRWILHIANWQFHAENARIVASPGSTNTSDTWYIEHIPVPSNTSNTLNNWWMFGL